MGQRFINALWFLAALWLLLVGLFAYALGGGDQGLLLFAIFGIPPLIIVGVVHYVAVGAA